MKILNSKQIRECDAYTIANEPILSIDLMERASKQLFTWITKNFSDSDEFLVLVGTGNNGGDALALSRLLFRSGYVNIRVCLLQISKTPSKDYKINLKRLKEINDIEIIELKQNDHFPKACDKTIVIDGIFGSGLSRPVTGYWADLINHVNKYSNNIISIDIPSGVYCDGNTGNTGAKIKATTTLTFQFPKMSSLFADNQEYFGKWYALDIGLHQDFFKKVHVNHFLLDKNDIKELIKKRRTFDHKGIFGHALLIAGSYCKNGAAILSAKGCLRSGVGLLTVHVPESGREIIQTAVPEAMVHIDESEIGYNEPAFLNKFAAIGVGPGIGTKKSVQNALFKLLENYKGNMVIDADAINILSANKKWFKLLNKNIILTPHPGEFDRLTHKHNSAYERFVTQCKFTKKHKAIVALKGAYTSITAPNCDVFFNSTGNPGMATAGSGDVLTGVILSLLAQGYSPVNATKAGVFLHGLAGDIAAYETGFEALIASDIINNLGKAFKNIVK